MQTEEEILHTSIINVADVELVPRLPEHAPTGESASQYGLRMGRFSASIGAKHLGYDITAVAPGKRAFPFHSHRVNEEVFFVLSGSGDVRIGGETFPLKSGDIVACPPGGPETAHQIINSGSDELRYLAVSTRISPEVCEYPDSSKFGVYGEFQPEDGAQTKLFRFVSREEHSIDYWDGE